MSELEHGTELPRVVGHSGFVAGCVPGELPEPGTITDALPCVTASDRGGAVWRLAEPGRGLDANLIELPPGDTIAEHQGPDLDVLVHVVAGSGVIVSSNGDGARGDTPIAEGDLVWLPRASRRGFLPGPQGLRYLTVHARKSGMQIGMRPAD